MSKITVADLLPPYMGDAAWQDLAKAMDEVFGQDIYPLIEGLGYLRSTLIADYGDPTLGHFLLNDIVPTRVNAREMIAPSEFDVYDMPTERLRLAQNGLILSNPGLLDIAGTPTLGNSPTHRLTQNIGKYWYHKGWDNGTFLDFINFCLGTNVVLFNLWTPDYKSFFEEGDLVIGTPVWEGGAWYPTTHVRIDISNSNITTPDLLKLVSLFYDIANYNLVLESVSKKEYHQIVDRRTEPGPVGLVPAELNAVLLGGHEDRSEWFPANDICPLPYLISPLTPAVAVLGVPFTGTLQAGNVTSIVESFLPVGFNATLGSGGVVTVSGTGTAISTFEVAFNFENACSTLPTSRFYVAGSSLQVGGSAPSQQTSILITSSAVVGDPLEVTRAPVFTGSPAPTISYQWRLNGVNNGAATSTPDARVASPGTWECVATATNQVGSASSTSNSTPVACAMPVVVQSLSPTEAIPGTIYSGTIVLTNVTSATFDSYPHWITVSGPVISGANYTYTLSGTVPIGRSSPSIARNPTVYLDGGTIRISDPGAYNGDPSPTLSQAWMRNGVPVGESGSSYTPSLGSAGSYQLRMYADNGINPPVFAYSNTVSLTAPSTVISPLITVSNSGFSVSLGAEFSSDLPMNPMTHTWVKDTFVVPGATGTSFAPTRPGAGTYYYFASQSNQVAVGTAASNPITITAPAFTSSPTIPGSATIGATLQAVPPTVSGFPTPVLSPSWRLNGTEVSTANSYVTTTAGSVSIVWSATNLADTVSIQTANCTVAANVCPLPAIASGLPWPAASTGVAYDHTIYLSDTTTTGTSVTGAPSWATISITQSGSGVNVRLYGTPTAEAVRGVLSVVGGWSVHRSGSGTYTIRSNGTAEHAPTGLTVITNWNSLAVNSEIGPQWSVRFTNVSGSTSLTSTSQALLGSWLSLASDRQIVCTGPAPGAVVHVSLNVSFSVDGGTTVAGTFPLTFQITDNTNS